MRTYMRPPNSCLRCYGVGWYESGDDSPHRGADVYCTELGCEAGDRAKAHDAGAPPDAITRAVWADLAERTPHGAGRQR
jgi:hypothetical protein